jgi:hypothetical protein
VAVGLVAVREWRQTPASQTRLDQPASLGVFQPSAEFSPQEGLYGVEDLDRTSDRYVEVVLDDTSAAGLVVRLPERIEVRQTQLDTDFYLNHVSY